MNDKDLPAVMEAIRSGKAKDVTASYDISVNDNVVTAMMKTKADGSVVLPMGYKYLLELPFIVKNVVGDFTNTAVQALLVWSLFIIKTLWWCDRRMVNE